MPGGDSNEKTRSIICIILIIGFALSNTYVSFSANYIHEPYINGYRISDPYNEYPPGRPYQYRIAFETFEKTWNERKVAMIIR